ncbi:MAG: hypothetical protein IJX17_01560, partial [Clostridia bacterium]|nr:hypothetical protein [Clostridia bacterium]
MSKNWLSKCRKCNSQYENIAGQWRCPACYKRREKIENIKKKINQNLEEIKRIKEDHKIENLENKRILKGKSKKKNQPIDEQMQYINNHIKYIDSRITLNQEINKLEETYKSEKVIKKKKNNGKSLKKIFSLTLLSVFITIIIMVLISYWNITLNVIIYIV